MNADSCLNINIGPAECTCMSIRQKIDCFAKLIEGLLLTLVRLGHVGMAFANHYETLKQLSWMRSLDHNQERPITL